MSRYADVVVPRHLQRPFTYSVPDPLQGRLCIGDSVLVPFGSVTLRGVVVRLVASLPTTVASHRVRPILALCQDGPGSAVDARLLTLARWVAEHYLAPLGRCLPLMLPPSPGGARGGRYVLTEAGRQVLQRQTSLPNDLRVLLDRLATRTKGGSLAWLQKQDHGFSRARLTHAVEQGWVCMEGASRTPPPPALELRPRVHQAAESGPSGSVVTRYWQQVLDPLLSRCPPQAMLVEALPEERMTAIVTACACMVAAGRRVIVVAPEVRRVDVLSERLQLRWGAGVERWASDRPPKERAAVWQRVRSGEVQIVVGTRTAVFAPLEAVGLICVDDEDHASLKAEQEPRFHARDVAWRRAELDGASLLLLSSHASLETRVRIEASPERCVKLSPDEAQPGPTVELIALDRPPRDSALSPVLVEAVRGALESGQRVALYLNRRGYAPALVCATCRAVPRCPRCQVAVSFSQASRRIRCGACGYQAEAPDCCPECQGLHMDMVGYGTERLEVEVARRFPRARLSRLDRDTTTRPAGRTRSRGGTLPEAWDIVIGTKLMVRELPPASCGLVGVVYAEAGLHVPDFRASERTYQDLWDAVHLANPAMGGRAMVQTCLPGHAVMQALATGDRSAFDREERALRQALDYPPYGAMVALEVAGGSPDSVRVVAEQWAHVLQTGAAAAAGGASGHVVTVLGPVPSGPGTIRGRSRWRLLVKGHQGETVRALVQRSVDRLDESARRHRIKLTVDVDPLNLI